MREGLREHKGTSQRSEEEAGEGLSGKMGTGWRRGLIMKVMMDLCVVPLGAGVSLSEYVAACERVLKGAGLDIMLHAFGTNVEGEWDAVFAAVKRCHEVIHEMGAPRVCTIIKLGTRTDRDQTLNDKVTSVRAKLGE